jgi:MFS family permease
VSASRAAAGLQPPAAPAVATIHGAIDAARMTPLHWRIWLLASMGVLLDAFDLFIIGVALPLIEAEFAPSVVEVGLVGAASPVGAIVGAAVAGRLADRFGRRLVFAVDLGLFVVFAVLSALAPSVAWLIGFRFLLGVAIGADYPISSSYVAEFMPSRVRGRMMVGALSFQAIGAVFGAVVGLAILLSVGSGGWRWMLAAGVVPALVVLVLRRDSPESPRWAQEHGRGDEAAAITRRLTGAEVVREEAPAARQPTAAATAVPSIRSLLAPPLRQRTILAVVPWFLMDVALYGIGLFTPTILGVLAVAGAGPTDAPSFVARDVRATEGAAALDLFLVLGFGLALVLIDRWGRLRLQALGFAGMAVGLLMVAAGVGGQTNLPLVLAGFALFNVLVNMGPNATTWTLPTELFPTALRASASGIAAAAGKAGAALGIFALPLLRDAWGLAPLMIAVAAVCAVGLAVTLAFGGGLETRGRGLEEAGG